MSEFLRLDMGPECLISLPGKLRESQGALYLGNIPNAQALGLVLHKRFIAILNCTDDPALDHLTANQGFSVKRLDHWDGFPYPEEKIREGVDFIGKHMACGDMVLVCCHAGVSRSPGMVLAYLLSLGYNYNEAVAGIRNARPIIQIHPKIDLSVRKFFGLAPRSEADLIPARNVSGY